jgi:hypothetical protein
LELFWGRERIMSSYSYGDFPSAKRQRADTSSAARCTQKTEKTEPSSALRLAFASTGSSSDEEQSSDGSIDEEELRDLFTRDPEQEAEQEESKTVRNALLGSVSLDETNLFDAERAIVEDAGFDLWKKWGGRWITGDGGFSIDGGEPWVYANGVEHESYERSLNVNGKNHDLYSFVYIYTDVFFRTVQDLLERKTAVDPIEKLWPSDSFADGDKEAFRKLMAEFLGGDARGHLERFSEFKPKGKMSLLMYVLSLAAKRILALVDEEDESGFDKDVEYLKLAMGVK